MNRIRFVIVLLAIVGCTDSNRDWHEPSQDPLPVPIAGSRNELKMVLGHLNEGLISPDNIPSHMGVDLRQADDEYRQYISIYYVDEDGGRIDGYSASTNRFDWERFRADSELAEARLKELGIYEEVEEWARLRDIGRGNMAR